MKKKNQYGSLTDKQVEILIQQGSSAENWSNVQVADDFDTSSVRNVAFSGIVKLGAFSGLVTDVNGNEKTSGIYNAAIKDCTIANNCRISNISDHISGYHVQENVCIESSGTIQASSKATFGNGTQINVINEAGGRQVQLFDDLNAQFAYMLSLHRYRPVLTERLNAIAAKSIEAAKSKPAVISTGTKISFAREIIDVTMGPATIIRGASRLVNGTILSTSESPTFIGADVNAKDFIIAEYATVDTGAILEKVFVGQGCKVAKNFIAEHSLFFANSELLGGEACSVFAGPYTVTHHKSSLLIAGLFSFFNAGSGANQSNHMYRLGPVHEGKLMRGTKTGSFTYMLWPSVTAPFSVVLGKHAHTFDSSSLPFSIILSSGEQTYIIPAVQLESSGTLRDGRKWPNRDNRGENKRDLISFDVITPYTVSMMINACEKLKKMIAEADPLSKTLVLNYAKIKKTDAEKAIEMYRRNAEIFLMEKALESLANKQENATAVFSDYWVDIAGLLMPKERLKTLWEKIETGEIDSIETFNSHIQNIHKSYQIDQQIWANEKLKEALKVDIESISSENLEKLKERYRILRNEFSDSVLIDAKKEYSQRSRTGYAFDGCENEKEIDFEQIRGVFDENEFVKELRKDIY